MSSTSVMLSLSVMTMCSEESVYLLRVDCTSSKYSQINNRLITAFIRALNLSLHRSVLSSTERVYPFACDLQILSEL